LRGRRRPRSCWAGVDATVSDLPRRQAPQRQAQHRRHRRLPVRDLRARAHSEGRGRQPAPPRDVGGGNEAEGWLMARTYAQVTVDIWEDPDWLALSQGAQRLYLLLHCQKKLSLNGLLPYTPARWARFAPDTDVADVEAAVAELEAGRFVVIDRETEELLIRTFVRHDITKVSKGATNSKLLKGMWSAWGAIESAELKRVVLREIPDAVWSAERCTPPERALQMRSDSVNRFSESIGESIHGIGSDAPPDQAPRKPRSRRIDSVNRTNESIHRTDSPASCNLHPATQ